MGVDNIFIEGKHTFAACLAVGQVESVPIKLLMSSEICYLLCCLMMGKRIAFTCLFIIHIVEVSRHIGIVGRVRVLGFHVLDTSISHLSELIP